MSAAIYSKLKDLRILLLRPSASGYLVIALLLLLALSRYIHLAADFPSGLGVKGTLYTDEGWWARNAVNWIREGSWYIDDGYNPIVNLPVFSLLQIVWFKAFGIGLSSARALSATCTIGISILLFLLVRREIDDRFAWVSPLIVLSSHATFAFSRLALLEMPMMFFMLLSLWLITRLSDAKAQYDLAPTYQDKTPIETWTLLASAATFLAAILIKTTALFAFPIALYLIIKRPHHGKKRIRQLLVWLLFLGLGYGLYYLLFVRGQTLNLSYFSSYNLEGKLVHKGLMDFLNGPPRAIKRSLRIFPVMFPGLLWAIAILIKNKVHRHSRLCQISILWSILSLAAFSISNYAPPRYFVVLIVPISISITMALQSLSLRTERDTGNHQSTNSVGSFSQSAAKLVMNRQLFLTMVLAAIIISLLRTGLYLRSPEFSLLNMASDISEQVNAQPADTRVVMGKFADTLALAAPIKGINDKMGFQPLSYRFDTFKPSYYVYLGSVSEEGFIDDNDYSIPKIVQERYQLQLIDTFDVFQNRVYGRPVFFYRMVPKS